VTGRLTYKEEDAGRNVFGLLARQGVAEPECVGGVGRGAAPVTSHTLV